MENALIGFLVVAIPVHLLLIAIPVTTTFRADISIKSKLLWCGFLFCAPFIGAALFHFKFRPSLFRGRLSEINTASERTRSGTLAPCDHD
jgi:hypothetical protein